MDRSLYTRPNKPKYIPVTRRARDFAPGGDQPAPIEILSVDRGTECHVTPASIGAVMVDYLELFDNASLLEPEFGTGNLIAAALDAGYPLNITGIEKHYDLFKAGSRRFADKSLSLVHDCFLEYAETCSDRFERVLMNPPFKHAKKHIVAALSLLAPGGIMVALVPVTFEHEAATDLEVLEQGAFACTLVRTKIIAFYG